MTPLNSTSQLRYIPKCAVITVFAYRGKIPDWSWTKLAKGHLASLLKSPLPLIDLLRIERLSSSPTSDNFLLIFNSHPIPRLLFVRARNLEGAGIFVNRYFRNSAIMGLLPTNSTSTVEYTPLHLFRPPTCPGGGTTSSRPMVAIIGWLARFPSGIFRDFY